MPLHFCHPNTSHGRDRDGSVCRAPRSAVTNCDAQNGWAQYSTGRMLPCLTVMSCGEIEAGASVASSLPAIFGLVEIDQAKAITATAAIATRIMRLRIYRLLIPDELRNGIGILCADPV